MKSTVSVVLAGGGTAGHVEPAMAVADALRAIDPDVRITALGTERGLETRLVPERGYHLELITPVPLPRKPSADLVRLPLRIRRAVRQTRAVLDDVDADVVIGFGGYVALPAYLAARRRVPVRATITSLDRMALRAEARAHFGFDDDANVLLVFGGSQGAQSLNRAVSAAAKDLAAAGISVLHAHGPKNVLDLREPADGDPPYVAVPYLDRMDLAYAAADLAVCRSGAMTVAEVTAVGLPAVYVPLPIGNGEQRLNALPVVNAGGGLVVDDADLSPQFVADTVAGLFTETGRLQAMTAAAALAGHRDAAQKVAQVALDIARESKRKGVR